MTNTELIFLCAQLGETPISPMGKPIEYEKIMGQEGHLGIVKVRQGYAETCFLCGRESEFVSEKRKTIKETFTDHGCAKEPKSEWVCDACTWALSHRSLRNYSIFASRLIAKHTLKHPSRAEIQQLLLHGFEGNNWLLCIAVSGQKWLHFKSPVNFFPYDPTSNQAYSVLLEEQVVQVRPARFAEWTKKVEEAYALGFSKELILKGGYNSNHIKKIGIKEFEAMEKHFAEYRKHRMFELVVFLAQKEKEEECTTDSTPVTNTLE